MTLPEDTADYQQLYRDQQGFLWSYCYRLTGNAVDADDLLHETFLRAMERPPVDTNRPWRPWLVRVATNLARDILRKRKHEYIGPWLPSPHPTDELNSERFEQLDLAAPNAQASYELQESVSFAFLLALEALSPRQRAVLLLREVYDYSTREVAQTLAMSTANVKTTLHRARRAVKAHLPQKQNRSASHTKSTRAALERLLATFAARDAHQLESLLAEEVQSLSDGNGQFYAARVPVLGRRRVARLYTSIAPPPEESLRYEIRTLNGLPALVAERPNAPAGFAQRFVLSIEIDEEGRISRLYTILAPEKLHRVFEIERKPQEKP